MEEGMQFSEFKNIFQRHVAKLVKNDATLFVVDVDKDELWEAYLSAFPEGTNEVYRERAEFDCSCCRHFIKEFGNVVVIKGNKTKSIWDFELEDARLAPVIKALDALISSAPVVDTFSPSFNHFGQDVSHEQKEDKSVRTWHHFYVQIPSTCVLNNGKSQGSQRNVTRTLKSVFGRSLEELSQDSIETVLELIAQKSLYRGEEWESNLKKFLSIHKKYHKLSEAKKDNFCWSESAKVGGAIGKIKNHSIGTLLSDITQGVELDTAVRKYEAMIAPTNYKRPKAIITKKMIERAQETIVELGLLASLGRRHTQLEDITVNNVLFANADASQRMGGDIFEELAETVALNPKTFDKIEEVGVEDFMDEILPNATSVSVLVENQHAPNMFSLIAPEIIDSEPLFRWNNGFSWAYNGNMADSMKQRVKAAGGNVEGVLRFSLQWNDEREYNGNDFDAHCIEPDRNLISYMQRKGHLSSGELDVDIQRPKKGTPAVENITWTNESKMQEGEYTFLVHNYSHNGGRTGFSAEIEYDGQTHSYEYANELRQNEKVTVARIYFSKKEGIKFLESLPSQTSSKEIWGVQTNQFHPVDIVMLSPNYWDERTEGNKHYFFSLKDCVNEDSPNGFFNEYLPEKFMEHKRVFAALGNKMRVEDSDEQISGVGFSSTQRNHLVCKVEGSFTRTIKIIF